MVARRLLLPKDRAIGAGRALHHGRSLVEEVLGGGSRGERLLARTVERVQVRVDQALDVHCAAAVAARPL